MPLIHYSHCPVCDSAELKEIFTVTDHTVSRENFKIVECGQCGLRITQDVPDQQSIGSYYKSEDYISHTDSSKGLINKLYRRVRKRTLQQKRKLVQQLTGLQQGYLLDLGSGTGAFADEMTKAGWQVTGLEPDPDARNNAKEIFGIELKSLDVFFDLPASAFDAITLWHVLEHVHEPNKYIDTLKRILKPGGKILIAVPNYTSRDAEVYREHWAAYDVPRHLYHFSPRAMEALIEKHGLQIEKKLPMWFDSFYVAMLSSRYRKGKTNLAGAFIQGLQSNLKAIGNPQKCSSVIYIIARVD
jgi:SAM-dependent methyltransferase